MDITMVHPSGDNLDLNFLLNVISSDSSLLGRFESMQKTMLHRDAFCKLSVVLDCWSVTFFLNGTFFQPAKVMVWNCHRRSYFNVKVIFQISRWIWKRDSPFPRLFWKKESRLIRWHQDLICPWRIKKNELILLSRFGAPEGWKKVQNLFTSTNSTPDHVLLDSGPNLGPRISRWDVYEFENCWYKSVRILEVLKLLFQQFLNLSNSQRYMSGSILGDLSNNRWSGVIHKTTKIPQRSPQWSKVWWLVQHWEGTGYLARQCGLRIAGREKGGHMTSLRGTAQHSTPRPGRLACTSQNGKIPQRFVNDAHAILVMLPPFSVDPGRRRSSCSIWSDWARQIRFCFFISLGIWDRGQDKRWKGSKGFISVIYNSWKEDQTTPYSDTALKLWDS
jgi:hypothetical protein